MFSHRESGFPQEVMSASPPIATAKTDCRKVHVCFAPNTAHVRCTEPCLFRAKSGSRLLDHLIGRGEQ